MKCKEAKDPAYREIPEVSGPLEPALFPKALKHLRERGLASFAREAAGHLKQLLFHRAVVLKWEDTPMNRLQQVLGSNPQVIALVSEFEAGISGDSLGVISKYAAHPDWIKWY